MSDTTGTLGVPARRANVYDRFDRNWKWMGFLASCVVVTALIGWWMVGAIREDVHENILGIIVLGIIAVISGLFSVAFFMMLLDRRQLVSPCPVCGHDESRAYNDGHAECSRCPTYLRAEGMTIFEEKPSAVGELPWYRLRIADLATLPIEDLKMPSGCALCEQATNQQRAVGIFTTTPASSGAGDAVVQGLQTAGLASYVRYTTVGRLDKSGKPIPQHTYNDQLHRLQFGLCAAGHGREGERAVVDWEGDLGFAGYRYYREFCRLNGLTRRAAADAAASRS